MKQVFVTILALTGLSLLILAILALYSGAQWLSLLSIFQILVLNIFIQVVLQLTDRLDTKAVPLKLLLDLIFIGGLLGITSLVFNWDNWPVTLATGGLVYLVSLGLDLIHLKQEAAEINLLIKKHNRIEDNNS